MKTRTNSAVWYEKYKRWQIQIQVDGVRKTFSSSTPGIAGKREANAKADEFLRTGMSASAKRVDALAHEWSETLKPTREHQSSENYVQYESIMRTKILPAIGKKRIGNLSCGDVQRIIDGMAKKGYAKKSMQNVRGCMTAFLKYCRKNRYCDMRLEDVEIPWDAHKVEKEILQPDALRTLMTVSTRKGHGKEPREEYYINAYRFQLVTGLRPGEMLARKKSDVRDGYLYITSAMNRLGEITNGKNTNATRRIKLTSLALQILKDQADTERRFGVSSTLLFPDTDGGYITEVKLYANWRAYQEQNGIPHISLYELRHTFVSICADNVPEVLVKKIVGHSHSMDTQGVYGHEFGDQASAAADAVESAFKNAMSTN